MQTKRIYSIPENVARRFDALIPSRSRSKVIAAFMREAIDKKEAELAFCAREVEKNEILTQEMKEWEKAHGQDGLDEAW